MAPPAVKVNGFNGEPTLTVVKARCATHLLWLHLLLFLLLMLMLWLCSTGGATHDTALSMQG
jgi:hypothetical protein